MLNIHTGLSCHLMCSVKTRDLSSTATLQQSYDHRNCIEWTRALNAGKTLKKITAGLLPIYFAIFSNNEQFS